MKHTFLSLLLVTFGLTACREQQAKVETDPVEANSDSSSLATEFQELEGQLVKLENELLREKAARLESEAEQRALLGEIKSLIQETDRKVAPVVEEKTATDPVSGEDAGKEQKAVESAANETATESGTSETTKGEKAAKPAGKDGDEARREAKARETARLKAVGEELPWLVTKSGQEYQDLVITGVTDLGVVFRHRTGVARIPFPELPPSWSERFFYDAERARRAAAAEEMAQQKRQEEMARIRQEQREKEAARAANERLNQLAQAVVELRRERDEEDARPVIRGNFWGANPFFFNANLGGLWGTNFQYSACPPLSLGTSTIFQPPLIRNEHHRVPVIRTKTIGPAPTLHAPRLRTSNPSRSRGRTAPAIQRVRPSAVVRPSARSRGSSPAVRRSRVVSPRSVRPSTRSRATPSPRVIRRTR